MAARIQNCEIIAFAIVASNQLSMDILLNVDNDSDNDSDNDEEI